MPSLQLYKQLQTETDKVLLTLGAPAILRRGATDYPCQVVLTNFTSMERMSQQLDPLDVKALISAKGLAITPDNEQDRLVTLVAGTTTEDVIYNFQRRPMPLSPAGVILYWTVPVRRF